MGSVAVLTGLIAAAGLEDAKATVRVLKKIGHAVKRAAVAVAKAAYKYSGAQDVVGCVTHPTLAGCAKAALTVALTVGTAGEGEIAEIGLNAAEHAGEDIAENAGEHAVEEGAGSTVEDAAESCVTGAVKGGESFTAGTKVLLASGKAVPISSSSPVRRSWPPAPGPARPGPRRSAWSWSTTTPTCTT